MSNIVDLKDVMERVLDDKELLCDLFDIFVEDFAGKRKQIWAAFEKMDCKEFQMAAHALKGSTGNISARRMYENCVMLDAKAKERDISGLKPSLELLDQQFEELKGEIARLKKELLG